MTVKTLLNLLLKLKERKERRKKGRTERRKEGKEIRQCSTPNAQFSSSIKKFLAVYSLVDDFVRQMEG